MVEDHLVRDAYGIPIRNTHYFYYNDMINIISVITINLYVGIFLFLNMIKITIMIII